MTFAIRAFVARLHLYGKAEARSGRKRAM